MKVPQVINSNIDTIIAIDGNSVIDNTTQIKITSTPITVKVTTLDLKTGTTNVIATTSMVREPAVDSYKITIADLSLTDKIGYVAYVEEVGTTYNMRSFKIDDFSKDNDSFEAVWMGLPYQVEINGSGTSYIKWYDTNAWGTCMFKAEAYEGGTGTTSATLAEKVTHRGPVVVGP